jgi:hypothetical protein
MLRGVAVSLGAAAALTLAAPAGAGHVPGAPPLSAFARTLAPAAPLVAAASRQVEVISHVNPREDINGNVWAHRGYAYMGSYGSARGSCGSGVRVYDLRNPRRPRRVAAFGRAASDPVLDGTYPDQVRVKAARTPAFRGDLAAIGLQRCRPPFDGTGGTRGFALYDVTRPASPRLLSVVNTLPAHGSHELWLETVGDRAYVYTAIPRAELHTSPNGTLPGNPDFRIYDVSDPARPVQVGQWGIWGNLGVRPIHDTYVHSVITDAAATRAYLSYWQYGTVILDISNPAVPRLLGRTLDPSQAEPPHAHSAALAHGERVLVETQEFGRFFGFTGSGYPRFYDVSDPVSPVLLSRLEPPGREASTVHDPKVRGNRAYFSWYDVGVSVVDITRPEAPREIALFVPGAGNNPQNPWCPDCTFVWGVFLHDDYFLASDMNTGLWALKLRCVVPNVRGMRLDAARVALTRGDCRIGKVRRVASRRPRRGRVLAQAPAPGARPRYPAAVRLTIGR